MSMDPPTWYDLRVLDNNAATSTLWYSYEAYYYCCCIMIIVLGDGIILYYCPTQNNAENGAGRAR